jgi:multiple sugar transport system permease protein
MKTLRYIVLALIFVVMVFPLVWMFRVSLLPTDAGLSLKGFLSEAFTLAIYYDIISSGNMMKYFINSSIVGAAVTAGNILFCFMVGYALSRYRFIGKNVWFYSVIFVLMIPVHIMIIPLYLLIFKLGIYDSYAALILPFLVNPIGIFLVKQYIDTLPPSMEEAARIDGAGELRILFRVVMPLWRFWPSRSF